MRQAVTPAEKAKRASAQAALSYIESGMRVGLGTGSTAAWLVTLLGERAKLEKMDLFCVPTSSRTRALAEECGLRVGELDEAGWLDLTIDGADEFDAELNLIKGGGGALLQEKIVASASDRMIVITDPSKRVATLGAFPLPVEVTKFGWEVSKSMIQDMLEGMDVSGRDISLRLNRDQPYVTDEGNYIVDLHLRRIGDPRRLAARLNAVPGVVESGLFIDIASVAVIGHETGEAEVLSKDGGSAAFGDDDDLFDGIE